MPGQYRFVAKWDYPCPLGISWRTECRGELNKIIEAYNQWQIDGFPSNKRRRLLALIEYGLQTIGQQDGGDAYQDELLLMKGFVESVDDDDLDLDCEGNGQ